MKFTKDAVNDRLEEIIYGDIKAENQRIHFMKLLIVFVCLLSALSLGSMGIGMLLGIIDNAPEIDTLTFSPQGYATTTYDTEGNLIATLVQEGSNREEVVYEPFLGSFYGELQLPAMAANPDAMHCYIPNGTNDLTYWTEDGEQFEGNVIADASIYDDNAKYLAFIMGDQECQIIENPAVTDGSSCVVIKDSYGCAFVPNLVDNYQTVYVLDFRKTARNIPEFVREHGIQDVIFMNNMTIAGTDTAADALYSIV